MREQLKPFALLLFVVALVLTTGCTKMSREAKYIGGAIVTSIAAGAAYMGNVFGIKKKKKEKPVVEDLSPTAKVEGSAK